jgi:hypothetical protein
MLAVTSRQRTNMPPTVNIPAEIHQLHTQVLLIQGALALEIEGKIRPAILGGFTRHSRLMTRASGTRQLIREITPQRWVMVLCKTGNSHGRVQFLEMPRSVCGTGNRNQ